MNAQEINYNGNTLLVVQGFDIEGYALFGYEKTFVLFIGRYENVHKTVSTAKQAISGNLMHRYSGPDPCAIPVSYTHLDVYKRQVCGCPSASVPDTTAHRTARWSSNRRK